MCCSAPAHGCLHIRGRRILIAAASWGPTLAVSPAGGRALVTVWAIEQENMKKVAKWQPISAPAAVAAGPDATPAQAQATAAERLGGSAEDGGEVGPDGRYANCVPSGDYFVPWHLPFHRIAGASPTAAAAIAAAAAGSAGSSIDAGGGSAVLLGAVAPQAAAVYGDTGPAVDSAKGAVVYQRYYHLFERGELDALVEEVPGAQVVDSFYDKDNWCVIFGPQ